MIQDEQDRIYKALENPPRSSLAVPMRMGGSSERQKFWEMVVLWAVEQDSLPSSAPLYAKFADAMLAEWDRRWREGK